MLRYMDFDLKIGRKGDHYTAEVIRSPAGEASCDFKLPFSEEKLENLVLKIGYSHRKTRRIYSPEMDAVRELGGKLFEAVFSSGVHSCLKSSMNEARYQEGTGLRLRLRFQDVPELFDLPWELLLDRSVDRFLALSNQTPIVRYIEMPEPIRPITATLPLQLLVMVSSPSDYEKLDVEREKTNLEEALMPLINEGKIHLEWMEDATLKTLQRRLRRGKYHIFHFIGHGGFDTEKEQGVLVLEDESGRGQQVEAWRIGTFIHDRSSSMRLVVLNSCEGARNSRSDPFAGVATTLVQQGIPAVVAMQFEITDRAANIFSSEFYTAIAEGFSVDAAVTEARMAIFAQPNDVEWGTPVLYMRSNDGVLFDLKRGTTEPETATQKPKKLKKVAPEIKGKNEGQTPHDKRFIFSDLTVADKKTGLAWARDANIAGKEMTWDDAFKFIDELNKQKYAGYSDWRLPTIEEFQTLVNHAERQGYQSDLVKLFNITGFRNVQAFYYWSSSIDAHITANAWSVSMGGGSVGASSKTNTGYIWPVRAGYKESRNDGRPLSEAVVTSHDKRFIFSDLTVADKKTGLMWTKDANIAKKYMTWDDAFKFIDELNKQEYAGYSDWRLPTKKEFKTLVDYAGSQGYKHDLDRLFNMTGFRNVQADGYWSSSIYAYYPTVAYHVVKIDGRVVSVDKTVSSYVWPVRAGQ